MSKASELRQDKRERQKEPRCAACGMKLLWWGERHTVRACELFASGISVSAVRSEMSKEALVKPPASDPRPDPRTHPEHWTE